MTSTPTRPSGSELLRWGPLTDSFPWGTRFGHLLDSMWRNPAGGDGPTPDADLRETDAGFVLEVDLPGINKKDVTIDVSGDRVSVYGERVQKEHDGVLRRSTRVVGSFALEVTLPARVDESAVSATLRDGVLTVELPKSDAAKSTHVEIR
jgi:HSP20 family protein